MMREIDLQIGFTTRLHIDLENVDHSQADENGRILLGTMDLVGLRPEIESARKNGAQVVWAALEIEKAMDMVISNHMFHPVGVNSSRDFFIDELLNSSILQFSHKKELVKKIVNKRKLLQGKQKNRLGGALKIVIERRNAFAHGHITAMQNSGCILRYFSGHQREDRLSDEYWDELEAGFQDAKDLLSMASNKLSEQIFQIASSEGDQVRGNESGGAE